MQTQSLFKTNRSGIALVAVLAILVVLALMAATFTIVIHQNMSMSRLQSESLALDMLLRNGLAHAQSVLTVADTAPGKESENTQPVTASHLISDNAFEPGLEDTKKFGPWIYVRDEDGNVHGRYRVRLEDEAAKVNLNKAYMNSLSKGHGWDTGEIYLPHALGVSKKAGKAIINYKYGNDGLPGGRGDDDHNNPKLMADGLDNTGDGVVDENDEGINDPREYSAMHPTGDDRAFVSFREAMPFIMNIGSIRKMSEATRQAIASEISKRATLFSVDLPGSPTLPTEEPSDINSVTARECRRRLLTANEQIPFEASSRKRNQIAANIIDYRDENHVLTTLGGQTYGVEAICFNEVMANEASSALWARQGYAYPAVMAIGSGGGNVWKKVYGSVDGERLIYSPSLFYTDSDEIWWPVVGTRKLWRIMDDGKKKFGKISISGNTVTFELPPGPGKWGSATKPTFEGTSWVGGDDASIREYYIDTLKLMNRRGKTVNNHIKFPNNFFKNQTVDFYNWGGSRLGSLKVKSSTSGHRFVATGSDAVTIMNGIRSAGTTNLSVAFRAWDLGLATASPEVSIYQMIRSRTGNAGEYFQVKITRDVSGPENSYRANTLNVSGNPASGEYTLEDNKTWYYNNGKPMRTDSLGFLDIFYTSSPKVDRNANIVQAISYIRLVAPETVEMYNASSTPISLANWRVICNTGSLATEIGRIRQTAYYDTVLKRRMIDDNPIVRPRGHFYLVNDAKLFDARYGNADFKWGSRANEQVPVFEMDKKHWGVAYKIAKVEWGWRAAEGLIYIEGSDDFDEGLLQGETLKFIYPGQENNPESWDGALIPANWWNNDQGKYVRVWSQFNAYAGTPPSTDGHIMVCGLPAQGGIVSLTLKNEYDQVCARTVEYGSVEKDELGYSTEKEDPTHYNWIKRQNPSIGGTEREALNQAMRGKRSRPAWIKNGPFGNVAELARIRTADDFDNLGVTGSKATGERKVGSLADVFCTSQLRLESCGANVETKGWEKAVYEVGAHDLRTVSARDADWEVNQWKGHTLRFLTGLLRGQKFPVASNTRNSLMLAEIDSDVIPRSAPDRKTIRNCKGAKFTVGPGYHTPFCYARQSDQEGEWLWRKAIPVPGTYDLYIYGLNDSIKTTEFLEENLNASIDTALWNYETERWDMLSTRKKYRKEDCFNAGKITPAHISPDGDVKMKLTAHDVAETGLSRDDEGGMVSEYQSGYAWFNYAVVTPLPVVGRVNVNTAPARLLESLPGITPKLADNIEKGLNADGVECLKPYTRLSDLFEVKDFTIDIFYRCANLLSINSYAYTVEVEAETLKDVNNDGKYSMDVDRVNAARKKRYVMELNPVPYGYSKVRQVEKY
jgi:hypothetical protein